MSEVAQRAGVASSSVSRVLSGHPDVSPAMRERVLAAVEELGYQPDFLAQSLRRGATLSVGYVLSSIANPLQAETVSGVESVLRAAGYSLVVMDSELDPALDIAHIRFLHSRRVDGLLLALASDRKRATHEILRQGELPMVAIDRELPARLGASTVVTDSRPGMTAAVHQLVDLGHRRIALISGSMEILPARDRLAAFRDAISQRSERVDAIEVQGDFSAEHGEAATCELLDRPEPPTAVIAGGSQILLGCLRALRKRGVRVGSDLALVTWDDVPFGELHDPPIATISRDMVGIGRVAAELLLQQLTDGIEPQTVVVPTTFSPAASCCPPS
jgi:LacI family transcriptional regulator